MGFIVLYLYLYGFYCNSSGDYMGFIVSVLYGFYCNSSGDYMGFIVLYLYLLGFIVVVEIIWVLL